MRGSLSAALALAAISSCLSVVGARGAEGDVAVIMKTLSNPYWGAMGAGVEEAAKKASVKYSIQDAPNESDLAAQLDSCQNLLTRGPKVLIAAAITPVNLLPCFKDANAKGIPVIDLDNQLDPKTTEAEGVKIAFAIGSNNRDLGEKAAEYLASKTTTGKVLIIEGIAGNPAGTARRDGFREKLAQIAPKMSVVAVLPGDWDRLKAANIANDTLQTTPDLVAIYAANDTMALGAVEALNTAGRKANVIVIGTDGNTDAVKAVKAGALDATVAQMPFLVGSQAVEQALKGGQVPGGKIVVPTLLLTKSVLDQNTDPLIQYLR